MQGTLYQSYCSPDTIEGALTHLNRADGARVRPIAGGTDLMVQLRERLVQTDMLVDVSSIPDLKRIWLDGDRLHLGAAATYTQLIESELVHQHAYLLAEAGRLIGGKQIQHMGTIGGNLANASPAGDTLPCLYALDADITIASLEGDRHVAMSEFMRGPRKTALRPHELITRISFDVVPEHAGSAFTKMGLRHSQAISVVDVAAVVGVLDGRIASVRVALGSVAPTIVRSPSVEQMLLRQAPSDDLLDRAAEATRHDIEPITDIRGSAAYRLYVAKPFVRQALDRALERASVSRAS